ncbi:MAG: MoaD/ThiS family protein [Nitrososphaerota archaeon]|jgi:molybdopterin converting factor small subunit|nr:MoaD/ThiS family protein [Nitrososphaerota archaeon]
MIQVRCLGHIGTAVGAKEITIQEPGLDASELVERVRAMTGLQDPGFSKYNTIVLVEDGEAFVPAGRSARISDGARVSLLPFSHGG